MEFTKPIKIGIAILDFKGSKSVCKLNLVKTDYTIKTVSCS